MLLLNIPHRRQQRESDCLVACAAMVLDYLHVPIRYDRIYKLLRAQPFGTPFRNIRFLKLLGLAVSIIDGQVETLQDYLESGLPILVSVTTGGWKYWGGEETDHVVLVTGLDLKRSVVYLHDPFFEDAPKELALADFELAWIEKDYLCAVIGLA